MLECSFPRFGVIWCDLISEKKKIPRELSPLFCFLFSYFLKHSMPKRGLLGRSTKQGAFLMYLMYVLPPP